LIKGFKKALFDTPKSDIKDACIAREPLLLLALFLFGVTYCPTARHLRLQNMFAWDMINNFCAILSNHYHVLKPYPTNTKLSLPTLNTHDHAWLKHLRMF
jgi:hypothetical protein